MSWVTPQAPTFGEIVVSLGKGTHDVSSVPDHIDDLSCWPELKDIGDMINVHRCLFHNPWFSADFAALKNNLITIFLLVVRKERGMQATVQLSTPGEACDLCT